MVTEELLRQFKMVDLSVTKNNIPGVLLLAAMFQSEEQASAFYNILATNNYDLQVAKNTYKEYVFTFVFIDSDVVYRFNSKLTSKKYPPFTWLNEGLPAVITTGYWGDGNQMHYIDNPLPISGGVNLN